jgi:hypothetical protein
MDRQADRQSGRQADEQADELRDGQAGRYRQCGKQTDDQAGGLEIDKLTGKQKERETSRRTGWRA